MRISRSLTVLSLLVALFAAVYAGIGLFSTGGEGSFEFTTLHGETVEMYGQGIYRNDASFRAPIFRGTDAVTLFVCVPVLLLAIAWYRRGSLRGGLLLTSMLAYFLYNSASLGFGAAYNNILLLYIASFSLSLFALVIAIQNIDLQTLAACTSARLPRRWIAAFLFLAGLSVMVWLIDIIGALASNGVPANLGPYSTESTYLLDLGIILPTAYLAGILVLRRSPWGTLLASILITVNITIGLVVASQSIMQALDGIILKPAEYAAYVAPFVTLSLIAIGLIISIQRSISDS
ncbi:MAG TPA: hypothetical protein VK888_04160 [Anaerolineales bacterium]|nr:hypothetical protein [Anaerolineales bacterium]